MLQPHGVTAPSISPCSSGPRLSAYRQHTGIPTGIRTAATPQTFHTLPCQDSNTSNPPPQNGLLDRPASAMRRLRYTRTSDICIGYSIAQAQGSSLRSEVPAPRLTCALGTALLKHRVVPYAVKCRHGIHNLPFFYAQPVSRRRENN